MQFRGIYRAKLIYVTATKNISKGFRRESPWSSILALERCVSIKQLIIKKSFPLTQWAKERPGVIFDSSWDTAIMPTRKKKPTAFNQF